MTKIISRALFNSVAKQVQERLHNTYYLKLNKKEEFRDYDPSVSALFFKPFKNRQDFYRKAASVPLGLVGLGIQGAEDLLLGIEAFIGAVVNLLSCDWDGAKHSFRRCFNFLLVAVEELLMAVVSPLVNLVDLLGSGVTTISSSLSEMTYSHDDDIREYEDQQERTMLSFSRH